MPDVLSNLKGRYHTHKKEMWFLPVVFPEADCDMVVSTSLKFMPASKVNSAAWQKAKPLE